ncbi:MAG: sulfite exporter TauE/SafE family protein, partial [Polaromonas sp.]|nr:sulfite exporter TauE/SafE family protein [Polaromonas sp.]
MFVPDVHEFMLVSFVFLAAGGVKGVLGMGLPTVAMGLLGLMMPVAEGAALLVLPALVTNLWQMSRGGHLRALLKRLWPMMAGVCLGVWLGRGWMATPGGHAMLWLGLSLVAYALVMLAGLRLPPPRPKREAG